MRIVEDEEPGPVGLAPQDGHLSFTHLRVRRHGAVLTIESGTKKDLVAHARLRRDTVHLWILEMPTADGEWETTPFRDLMDRQVERLVGDLAWALAPR